MGKYVTQAEALRQHPTIHYNCAQSVLVAFAQPMGYTPEQAYQLGAHLGGGMRHGGTCGALSGALIAMGVLGYDDHEARNLVSQFQNAYGDTGCKELLTTSKARGEDKLPHCNKLVLAMAAAVEELVAQRES